MSDHTHTVITPGCYRCELNEDEMRDAMSNTERDELAKAIHSGFFRLTDGGFDDEDEAIADAVQNSHWLASRDRRMKAEALTEAATAADGFELGEEAWAGDWLRARAGEIREENN